MHFGVTYETDTGGIFMSEQLEEFKSTQRRCGEVKQAETV